MAENVKVAVRVRPFNGREKKMKSKLIIDMSGQTTSIYDPTDLEKNGMGKANPKKFSFDYSYWSHDGFKELDDKYLSPTDNKYADQKKVFNDLGKGVLQNTWSGFNCSLFAYGQTGSGKSYSMVGYDTNKGIVPVCCDELFKGIEAKAKSNTKGDEYQVTFSMLEIYNEQVRDLLQPSSFKIKGGLKVRENPKLGLFYVEGVKPVPVTNYKSIEDLMRKGTENRTVASTNMNATSSRAHTVVTINFTQKIKSENRTTTSIINLVDLAGSERANSTGAEGDRLKEGAAINKSLSMLGNCIKALADVGAGKNVKVPFRESKLTMLLKNALCGNSKTVMIAALSPAGINYDETLSTLRFADRAKSLKTTAVKNESATDKLIRELKEQNAKLLKQLKQAGSGTSVGISTAEVEEMKRAMQAELEANKNDLMSWEERLKQSEMEILEAREQDRKNSEKQKTIPHFWNLHEDPALTAKILHFINKGKVKVGSKKSEPLPDIQLTGLGIQTDHCVLDVKKDKVFIIPTNGATIFLNGNEIKEKKELHHHDRVLFGQSNLFVFHHPKDYAKQQRKGKCEAPPTFDLAQEEIVDNSGLKNLLGNSDSKSKEDLLLQEDLIQLWPMVTQANAMSEELDKRVKFELTLISPQARGKKEGRAQVFVKVKDMESDNEYLWDQNAFINRKYLMQEMYQNFVEGEDYEKPKAEDPFWEDPDTDILIGSVQVYLSPLAHVVELDESLQITNYKGQEQGYLNIEIYPCDSNGVDLTAENDAFVENPNELVGKKLFFNIRIKSGRGLPQRINKVYCRYDFYLEDKSSITQVIQGTTNPEFQHSKMFSYKPVTNQFLEYLQNEFLIIDVCGTQKGPRTSSTQLSTRELMVKEKGMTNMGPIQKDSEEKMYDYQYKMAAEVGTLKHRTRRAEEKLRKIQALVEEANMNKASTLDLNKVSKILKSSHRMKATAKVILEMERAKRDNMGKVTSEACSIQ